ncbi:tetratricopeptide repeat protein [Salipaludibacillus sp. LMS25]|jgi:tetratricopeptide (TPR) repeat protein|uniref:tetratricopeptide repeat protein n=1 Tax=Salipaludibacillus sp. LMS25 TaxID=2924031 RepID=UPI0020D004D9|nr:tetratricopeptide repeat protein [Salipaludibacillus sp. LMS25]UTR15928.1 tetratricopeptide repeat protein [Salipaludibacillus sp. LMS25]
MVEIDFFSILSLTLLALALYYFIYLFHHTSNKNYLFLIAIVIINALGHFNVMNLYILNISASIVAFGSFLFEKRRTWLYLVFCYLSYTMFLYFYWLTWNDYFFYGSIVIKIIKIFFVIRLINELYKEPLPHKQIIRRKNKFERMSNKSKINYLNRLLKHTPERENYLVRANVFKAMGNYKAAEADYRQVIDLAPSHFSGYFNIGLLYMEQKDYNESIAQFSKALDLAKGNDKARIYFNKALSYYHLGNYQKALQDVKKSQKKFPGDVDIFILRARLFLAMGHLHKALTEIRTALTTIQQYQLDNKEEVKAKTLILYAELLAKQDKKTSTNKSDKKIIKMITEARQLGFSEEKLNKIYQLKPYLSRIQ